MNSRIQNQLNMVGACLIVANSTDYKPVWTGKRFIEAWKRARIIVDTGGGHSGTPPTPPTPPTTPGK